jgi:dTDP-4-dehydrorhamnose reductase
MTINNKILILGVSGMLGNTLYRYFRDKTEKFVIGASRNSISAPSMYQTEHAILESGFDVDNTDALLELFNKHRPNIVVNCIGIIKQMSVADDPLVAIPINAELPHRISKLCKLINARLIHISTDCVFSGKKGMYTEEDVPDATDLYGRSKSLGEVIDDLHAITLRTSLIGHELNSARSLVNWFLSCQDRVQGYRRAIFSGFPTVEIARIIDEYIIPNPSLHGLMQISAEPIDKYTLLNLIKVVYDKSIEIQEDNKVMIDRSLDSTRFKLITGYQPPHWKKLIQSMQDFQ